MGARTNNSLVLSNWVVLVLVLVIGYFMIGSGQLKAEDEYDSSSFVPVYDADDQLIGISNQSDFSVLEYRIGNSGEVYGTGVCHLAHYTYLETNNFVVQPPAEMAGQTATQHTSYTDPIDISDLNLDAGSDAICLRGKKTGSDTFVYGSVGKLTELNTADLTPTSFDDGSSSGEEEQAEVLVDTGGGQNNSILVASVAVIVAFLTTSFHIYRRSS